MNGQDFIPGVYNYCDRWCERCYLTTQCRVFEQSEMAAAGRQDEDNKAFWDHLKNNFEEAVVLLHRAAAEYGIDLNNIPEEEIRTIEERESAIRSKVKASLLHRLSLRYVMEGRKWLEEKEHFEQMTSDYIQQFELGLKSEEAIRMDMALVKDCLDVVQWYLHFIHVKFARALSGRESGEQWQEEHGFLKDSDGSAKIALIATQRSIDAWVKLYDLLPGEQEPILGLLALLQKIKLLGEKEFPGAAAFRRPGFDD